MSVAMGMAQSITLAVRDSPLERVFPLIEQQSGYRFYYRVELLQQARPVSLALTSVSLTSCLDALFQDQPLQYRIVERNIVVNRRPTAEAAKVASSDSVRTVYGKVVNEEDEPLSNASVSVRGGQTVALTDASGGFRLAVPDRDVLITVTIVGYASQVVRAVPGRSLTVRMKVTNREMDRVVVIGYGTSRRRDLTGSVASLAFDDAVSGVSMQSMEQGMRGRLAGVTVRQTSHAPGGSISVQLRGAASLSGNTEPLYVIDGFPMEGGNQMPRGEVTGPRNEQAESSPPHNLLNFLSPEDIESIEVLKDASSTAIYGSRGANGVVLITTRKSKSARPTFVFNHYMEATSLMRRLDLLDAPSFARMMNEQYVNTSSLSGMSYESILSSGLMPFPGAVNASGVYVPSPEDFSSGRYKGTDWQEELYRTALASNTSLSFNGGAGKTKYYFSGNYRDVQGMIPGSAMKRFSLNANLQSQLFDRLSFSNNLVLSGSFLNNIQEGVANFGIGRPVITRILQHPPTSPIGEVFEDINQGVEALDDPYTMATRFIDKRQDYNVFETANIEFRIMKDLVLNVRGGARFFLQNRDMYFPLSTDRGQRVRGQASNSGMTRYTLLNENTLNYRKRVGRHSLNGLAGFTQELSDMRNQYVSVNGFSNDLLSFYSLQSGTVYNPPQSGFTSTRLNSFIARANYGYDDRYLFTLSLRADGSSRFGTDNKWGRFPSGAFAWRVGKERFMQRAGFVSDLKLRTSYGLTGNQSLLPYQSMAQLGPGIATLNGTTVSVGYQNTILDNPSLRWETTRQLDVGIDLGLFDDRITIAADHYVRHTRDLLQQILLPGSSGYVFQFQNIGSVMNRGFEVQVNARIADKAVKWEVGANISRNINRIQDLGDAQMLPGRWVISYDFYPFKLKVGESIGTIYGYRTDGVFRTQAEVNAAPAQDNRSIGEFRYVDVNNDGKVVNDGSDEVMLGSTNPDFSFGFTTQLKYRAFDLSAMVYGSVGQQMVNMNLVYGSRMVGSWNAYRDIFENAFRPEVKDASGKVVQPGNPDGTWNMAGSLGARTRNVLIDRWVEDASFARLGNLTIGYNLPRKPKYLRNLRLYASGNNLLTITPYRYGYDPEASMYGQDPTRRGVDFGVYPPGRVIKFGVDITF